MSTEEIDKKVKDLAEIAAKIHSSEIINPLDLRKADKLRKELYGKWDSIKGTYCKK